MAHPREGTPRPKGPARLGEGRTRSTWGGGGDIDPLTPIPGTAGGIGRTPVPVAESTRRPGEEAFTPSEIHGGEGLEQRSAPGEPTQDQGKPAGRFQDTKVGEGPEWVLPEPSEPHRPPRGGDALREVPSQRNEEWGESIKTRVSLPRTEGSKS